MIECPLLLPVMRDDADYQSTPGATVAQAGADDCAAAAASVGSAAAATAAAGHEYAAAAHLPSWRWRDGCAEGRWKLTKL